MTKTLLATFVVLAAALAGCTKDAPPSTTPTTMPPASNVAELAYFAKATGEGPNRTYSFEGPATAKAGWTRVTLRGDDFEPHQVDFVKLNGSYADFSAAMMHGAAMGNMSMMPAMHEIGGVGAVTMDRTGVAYVDLEPGTYAVVCMIPGAAGPHAFHGMMIELNVTAAEADPAPPAPAFTVVLSDYGFEIEGNVTPGNHTYAIRNDGTVPHEAPLFLVHEGATFFEFLQAIESPQGPPPGEAIGGATPIQPGQTVYAWNEFAAGHYGFACFVQSSAQEPPHIALGMMHDFHVNATA